MGTIVPQKNAKMTKFLEFCVIVVILQAVVVSSNFVQSPTAELKTNIDDTFYIDQDYKDIEVRKQSQLDDNTLLEDELQPIDNDNDNGWLLNSVHRVRRGLNRLFGLKSAEKQIPKSNFHAHKEFQSNPRTLKTPANLKQYRKRQTLNNEDFESSGTLEEDEPVEFWQTQFLLNEMWTDNFLNRSSQEFQHLEKTLETELIQLYNSASQGDDEPNMKVWLLHVIQTNDAYKFYVVLRIQLQEHITNFGDVLLDRIRTFHVLSSLSVDIDGEYYFKNVRVNTYEPSTENTNLDIPINPPTEENNNVDVEDYGSGEPSYPSCEKFDCQDGQNIICESQKCDGIKDCLNDADEIDCPFENTTSEIVCNEGEYYCNNECIPNEQLCTPEDQVCQEDQHRCLSGDCISKSQLCDNVFDCPSKDDEEGCRKCLQHIEFSCQNGACIPNESVCDGISDCKYGDDEAFRLCNCTNTQFKCLRGGGCIPKTQVCDGISQCKDNSDESSCNLQHKFSENRTSLDCLSFQFQCSDGVCISSYKRCNGITDCADDSDEINCPLNYDDTDYALANDCSRDEFFCDNTCHPSEIRCNGVRDCTDYSDEENCVSTPRQPPVSYPCPEFTCPNGNCYSTSQRCDGARDCEDGSDESNCCTSNQFQCRNGECVPDSAQCNGHRECRDGSDEEGCESYHVCSPSQFRCDNGQCVSRYARCDGHTDCYDSSDEEHCTIKTPTNPQLDLKTYPNSQTIKQSYEVIFRCRDEGPLRAKVRWTRPGGLPLPIGAVNEKGRLEIPNIRVEDAGTYICEAIGYPRYTPGQQVAVTLNVERYNTERPPKACHETQATCMNGECIDRRQVCDGIAHCSDGSDEHSCSHGRGCQPNQFKCKNSKCVERIWRCDGENDCGDNSDEETCDLQESNGICRYNEFQCQRGPCIPKAFHCDDTSDCLDNSDEIGCMAPVPVRPPPPRQILSQGDALNLSCVATGVPTPVVGWRLNWGFVPEKCVAKSHGGTGTLYCPDMQQADSGAYSCEIINSKGTVFVTPDTLVTVNVPQASNVCPAGFFNMLARYREDCINCFCFDITKNCRSADLYTYALKPPIISKRVVNLEISPYKNIVINEAIQPNVVVWPHGVQFRASNVVYDQREEPYLALPEEYMGNQLKSYGGYLRYTVNFVGTGRPTRTPDVVIIGNGYTLVYNTDITLEAGTKNEIAVKFVPGEWRNYDRRMATREELMMVLANIENIFIRLSYIDDTEREVELTNISLDSAGLQDHGLGSASLVEHCMCPPGYAGDSCESCAPGFMRQNTGAWLGRCVPMVVETCPHGSYGDPRRGIPCRECPCPQTGPNNYANGCEMTPDGDVSCYCKAGYVGRRCELCAPGYTGNPLKSGVGCYPKPEINCNAEGTYLTNPNGTCECKTLVTGTYCDRCSPESFFLNSFTYTGCIECFCSGLTRQCTSSALYRDQVVSTFERFRGPHGFELVADFDSHNLVKVPIIQGENSLQFSQPPTSDPLYWSLPSQYLGNKLTAYGGKLGYNLSYNPLPGGSMSRNNAPDVVIKSTDGMSIIHYRKSSVNPNQSSPYAVPIIESAWQRVDGIAVNRERLLMSLSKIEAIYIKATYTTSTKDGALVQVSLDTATSNNIGTTRAVEVEECRCPPGYAGLSCERCANGYGPNGNSQQYGAVCEPCNCHNHADQCDPETGVCIDCNHNTEGDNCEQCVPGYIGNAVDGTPYDCRPDREYYPTQPPPDTSYNQTQCRYCNQAGTNSCDNGYCLCKSNVHGTICDQCRQGTYDLSENNPQGCQDCYCSGKSNTCRSSNLYREEIPADFLAGLAYIADEEGSILVNPQDIPFNISTNTLEYTTVTYDQIYWSIREALLGNQLNSYGGKLSFKLHVESNANDQYEAGNDVVLIGNGIKLMWSKPEYEQNEHFNVRLHETENWQKMERGYAVPASRHDIMSVLSNLEHLLIRASTKRPTTRTVLGDVILETAVDHPTIYGQIATDVEICNCPLNYVGNSCENCAPLNYRDAEDNCQVCPCQEETTESCNLDITGYAVCNCKSGYSGDRCQYDDYYTPEPTTAAPDADYKTKITVTITPPKITIIPVGGSLVLTCNGYLAWNNIPVLVSWYKQNGQLPRDYYMDNGELHLYNLQIYDSGTYICQAVSNQTMAVFEDKVSITITEESQRSPAQIINLPSEFEFEEYQPNEINCEVSGNPIPRVTWTRIDGQMSNDIRTEDTRLIFNSPRVTDHGNYRCYAFNDDGEDERTTQIIVRPATVVPPPPARDHVFIDPPGYTGEVGQDVRLTCNPTASLPLVYEWKKDGYPIYRDNHYVVIANILEIRQPTVRESGVYTCTGVDQILRNNYTDKVLVNIVDNGVYTTPPTYPGATLPIVQPFPKEIVIPKGGDKNLTCRATGYPQPRIRWTKMHESLAYNVYAKDNVLQITNANIQNRGMYVCIAENSAGSGQEDTYIDIDTRERPTAQVENLQNRPVFAGGEVQLYCSGSGMPEPTLKWIRTDGRPLPPTATEIEAGQVIIHNATVDDGTQYQCIAENELGRATAMTEIRVIETPVISIEPSDEVLYYNEGANVILTCTATGTPAPTVQWVADDAEPNTRALFSNRVQYGQATLELNGVTRLDSKSWRCIASNEAGSVEKWSTLEIRPLDSSRDGQSWDASRGDAPDDGVYNPQPEEEPERNNQPDNFERDPEIYPDPESHDKVFEANLGEETKLTCDLDEQTQWDRVDGHPLGREVIIHGNTLLIPSVDQQDAGRYRCSAYDSQRNFLREYIVELRVIPLPHITLHPKIPLVVQPNENVEIFCNATGEQPITVSWHAYNDRTVPASVRFEGPYLRFRAITPADAGHYICTATNRYGKATETAEVQVSRGAASLEQPQTQKYNIREGEDVQLKCDVPRELVRAPVQYTWRRADGRRLPAQARRNNHVLYIPAARPEDHGTYICEASSYGRTFAPSYAELGIIPNIPQQQQREFYTTTTQRSREPTLKLNQQHSTLEVGQATEVECYASDGSYSDIVWERANGWPLPPNIRQVENRLVISGAQPRDAGEYTCKCRTDSGHQYTTNFELEVNPIQQNPNQPKIVHVNVGDDVSLPCEQDSLNSPSYYKWTRQYGKIQPGSDVAGPVLRLSGVQAHDAGSYICTVTTSDGENHDLLTTLVVTGAIPQFQQNPLSYMVFPKLTDSNVRFNFDISFRPETPNGLLLFNSQNHGSGFYIALSLSNGFPEFRYDFDGTPMIIRAEKPISLNEWHTIRVNRFRRDGYMQVDDQHPVALPTISQIARVDLVADLYIGGVPNWNILPPSATEYQENFVGCISRLTLQDTAVELMKEAKYKVGITSCVPCEENLCQNGGICIESQTEMAYTCNCQSGWTGRNCAIAGTQCAPGLCGSGRCENTDFGMECLCPLNRTGDRCQYIEHLNEHSIAFRSNGYAAYNTPRASKLNIKFQVRPNSLEDSVILYTSESKHPSGDYVAVLLHNEHVELVINTGARLNPVIVRSLQPLPLNKWTEIEISRKFSESILRVDNEPEQKGKANGLGRQLYIKTPLYMGGYDYQNVKLNHDINITKGFDGCIANLQEAKRPINLITHLIDAANVQNCGETNEVDEHFTPTDAKQSRPGKEDEIVSCDSDPCENNGTCFMNNDEVHCNCLIGFSGKYCEEHISLEYSAKFQGNGYLELHRNQFNEVVDQKYTFAALVFSTTQPNGLLLWWGQKNKEEYDGQDFISLSVVDGIIEYAFRLNGEETIIRNPDKRVDDGARHLVIIKRTDNTGVLEIDHLLDAGETRPTGKYTMHLPGHIFIGGAPNVDQLTGGRHTKNFIGCVHLVEGEGSHIINIKDAAVSGINIETCPDIEEDIGKDPPVV